MTISPISPMTQQKFTPAIGDLDGDGDYEIIIGTNNNLRVLDIEEDMGQQYSWDAYRGEIFEMDSSMCHYRI